MSSNVTIAKLCCAADCTPLAQSLIINGLLFIDESSSAPGETVSRDHCSSDGYAIPATAASSSRPGEH